jgi:hypothetical protein
LRHLTGNGSFFGTLGFSRKIFKFFSFILPAPAPDDPFPLIMNGNGRVLENFRVFLKKIEKFLKKFQVQHSCGFQPICDLSGGHKSTFSVTLAPFRPQVSSHQESYKMTTRNDA